MYWSGEIHTLGQTNATPIMSITYGQAACATCIVSFGKSFATWYSGSGELSSYGRPSRDWSVSIPQT